MKKFRFQIQRCITVEFCGYNREEARMNLLENLDDYAELMVDANCYVSDGVEIE